MVPLIIIKFLPNEWWQTVVIHHWDILFGNFNISAYQYFFPAMQVSSNNKLDNGISREDPIMSVVGKLLLGNVDFRNNNILKYCGMGLFPQKVKPTLASPPNHLPSVHPAPNIQVLFLLSLVQKGDLSSFRSIFLSFSGSKHPVFARPSSRCSWPSGELVLALVELKVYWGN